MTTRAPDKTTLFQSYRGLLFAIAYRMTGSGADAEDLVQEAWFRWDRNADEVLAPKAWLTKVITHLALDYLKSARVQRELYVGPWLPEPIVTDAVPGTHAGDLSDSLSSALLLLLERLSPPERAAFLLREVFDYAYSEIASMLDTTEVNCRQLVKRAKGRLASDKSRFIVNRDAEEQFALRFAAAVHEGNMDGLLALLSDDVILYSDGGGKALAAINPIYGPDRVARFLFGVFKKKPADMQFRLIQVNGGPALLMHAGRLPDSVVTFAVAEGRITGIYSVRNPDKLRAAASLLSEVTS